MAARFIDHDTCRNSFEAGLVVKKLQSVLQCVGSSQASMNEVCMFDKKDISVMSA